MTSTNKAESCENNLLVSAFFALSSLWNIIFILSIIEHIFPKGNLQKKVYGWGDEDIENNIIPFSLMITKAKPCNKPFKKIIQANKGV